MNAAKYDVATMLYQERELNIFEQNLVKASGWGMSAAARLLRDHAEQMKVAEDFGNIFENEEDVMWKQKRQTTPPCTYRKLWQSTGCLRGKEEE